ncbi:hypothetical protein IWZ01DRAFT_500754 [Phyllosticta capitalensis]
MRPLLFLQISPATTTTPIPSCPPMSISDPGHLSPPHHAALFLQSDFASLETTATTPKRKKNCSILALCPI